jgi:OOP family OmpA-OmpF porin
MTISASPATRRAGILGALVILLALLLSCCSQPPPPPSEPAGLILIVGVHRNEEVPSVPPVLHQRVRKVVESGGGIAVIAVDGRPRLVAGPATFPVTDANQAAHDDDVTNAVDSITRTVKAAKAGHDGSDMVGALWLAADTATSQMPGATIAIVDPLLPDTGAVDLTVPGMLAANPAEVVDGLRRGSALPALHGHRVTLVGAGYTAAPQAPLTGAQRAAVTQLWTSVLQAAGASVEVVPFPRTGNGPATSYTTRTVPLPDTTPVKPYTSMPAVFRDDSPLGFLPDTTILRDPAGARAQLAQLATWLRADGGRRVRVTGTCASFGTVTGQKTLSTQRAEAIRGVLLGLGVAPGQVGTYGAGYIASPPDQRPDGSHDPAASALNRSIRLTVTG